MRHLAVATPPAGGGSLTRTEIGGATNTSAATSFNYAVTVTSGDVLAVAVMANRSSYDGNAVNLACTDDLGASSAPISGGWTKVQNTGSYGAYPPVQDACIFYITASHSVSGNVTISTDNACVQTCKIYKFENCNGVLGSGTATDVTWPTSSADITLSATPTAADITLWACHYYSNSNTTGNEIAGDGTELIETDNGAANLIHAIGYVDSSTSGTVNVSSTANNGNNGQIRAVAVTFDEA